jgi:hypothetical protein
MHFGTLRDSHLCLAVNQLVRGSNPRGGAKAVRKDGFFDTAGSKGKARLLTGGKADMDVR